MFRKEHRQDANKENVERKQGADTFTLSASSAVHVLYEPSMLFFITTTIQNIYTDIMQVKTRHGPCRSLRQPVHREFSICIKQAWNVQS